MPTLAGKCTDGDHLNRHLTTHAASHLTPRRSPENEEAPTPVESASHDARGESAKKSPQAAEVSRDLWNVAHVPIGAGSHYSWFARSSFVIAALLIVGCAQSDARVVEYTFQTTKESAARVTQDGPVRLVDVPAFYLVAQDDARCEVDSVAYLAAKKGSRVACDWSSQ
jgi:hypothetical protein